MDRFFLKVVVLVCAIWSLASFSPANSQELSKHKLSNQDILYMASLGLGDDVILEKIRTAPETDFATDVESLKALKAAHVSDAVIRAMISPKAATTVVKPTSTPALPVVSTQAQIANPKIYIAPQNGFESYLAGAFSKKSVPAQIVQAPEDADYVLSPAPVEQKPESTGGKIARCLFVYCAGIEGSQTASVTLTDAKKNVVVWAYNVHKGGSKNFQSSAEACAKHLKNWLEHTGK
jgi:hypothetical protein